MIMYAKRYLILRGISPNGRVWHEVEEKPVRVATLIDEQEFIKEGALIHHKTVFLEDRLHDWDWQDGKFCYYTRVAERADVVLVFELELEKK